MAKPEVIETPTLDVAPVAASPKDGDKVIINTVYGDMAHPIAGRIESGANFPCVWDYWFNDQFVAGKIMMAPF